MEALLMVCAVMGAAWIGSLVIWASALGFRAAVVWAIRSSKFGGRARLEFESLAREFRDSRPGSYVNLTRAQKQIAEDRVRMSAERVNAIKIFGEDQKKVRKCKTRKKV